MEETRCWSSRWLSTPLAVLDLSQAEDSRQENPQLPENSRSQERSGQIRQRNGSLPCWAGDHRAVQQELCPEQVFSVPEDEAGVETECRPRQIQNSGTGTLRWKRSREGADDH